MRIVLELNPAAGVFDVDTGDTKGRADIAEVAAAMPGRVQRAIRTELNDAARILEDQADIVAAEAKERRQAERDLRAAVTAADAITASLPEPTADPVTDPADPQTPA